MSILKLYNASGLVWKLELWGVGLTSWAASELHLSLLLPWPTIKEVQAAVLSNASQIVDSCIACFANVTLFISG